MSSSLSAPRFHNDPEEEQPLAFHDDDDEDDGDNVAPNFHAGDDDALPRSLWPTVQSAFASTGATGSLASRDLRSTASTATTIASKSVSVASHTAAGLRAVHLTAAAAGVAGLTAGTGGIALGVLARHTVTCRCALAEQIVSELFSPQNYLAIRVMNSDQAGDRIAPKMKSV
jgi:hypothetical protein